MFPFEDRQFGAEDVHHSKDVAEGDVCEQDKESTVDILDPFLVHILLQVDNTKDQSQNNSLSYLGSGSQGVLEGGLPIPPCKGTQLLGPGSKVWRDFVIVILELSSFFVLVLHCCLHLFPQLAVVKSVTEERYSSAVFSLIARFNSKKADEMIGRVKVLRAGEPLGCKEILGSSPSRTYVSSAAFCQ